MESPKEVLNSFILEMKNWEIEFKHAKDNDRLVIRNADFIQKTKEHLNTIYNKYLSEKTLTISQSRLDDLSVMNPPEYQQVITQEVIYPKKAEIITARLHKEYAKYLLVLENNSWKIDRIAFASLDWKIKKNLF